MTDEELDALVTKAMDRAIERLQKLHDYAGRPTWDQVLREELSKPITTLRAQLAEAREIFTKERALRMAVETHLNVETNRTTQIEVNATADRIYAWEHTLDGVTRGSWSPYPDEANDPPRGTPYARADRAEAALAAQIEVDAGIAYAQDLSVMVCTEADIRARIIAVAIRDQPHDRTALDRMLAEAREKALREAADMVRSTAYTTNGGARSLEPVLAGFAGMDMHHATIADAILALIEKEKPNEQR